MQQHEVSLAARVLRQRLGVDPTIGIITGSGFRFCPLQARSMGRVSYSDLPGMDVSSVAGHASHAEMLDLHGRHVLVCSGRLHAYEGHEHTSCMQLIDLLHAAGIRTVIITNAAGGLHWRYVPGDIALITDTIDLTFLGSTRHGYTSVPDPCLLVDHDLQTSILETCAQQHIALETGTYCQVLGPSYETRAEIRMLRRLGADLVGMSTVREQRHARSLGMATLAFSMVTNTLSDTMQRSVTHDEVLDVASSAGHHLSTIITTLLTQEIV